VLYISGTRADYGPARRLLQGIHTHPGFELSVLVTGMHLDPEHGETWGEIERDGLRIAERLQGRVSGDSLEAMAASVGLYLYGMSQTVARLRPDIVLVLGDRGEQLAGAMAAAFQNITVVHLCGGALSGSIDDSIRHAITKFAHYHLPGFAEHAQRIIQMGEDPARVRVVGLPGGNIRPDAVFSRERICADYHLPLDQPYLLVVQHPVTHSSARAGEQVEETLAALAGLGHPALLANPNDDAGGRSILAVMEEYARRFPHLRLLPPPGSREVFASIMAHAGALVGNSSSALVEAMSVALPVVNIGDRQKGREHLACWINVGYDRREIAKGVEKALGDPEYRQALHRLAAEMAARTAEEQVVDFLAQLDLTAASHPKEFFAGAVPLQGPA
jgi:UDP-N-acetylglucosamine 2-epimerase (non-hydrolysing)/GDP/UDP-N,N'-diacetylbacillosamine 2-epimerase (hydrolysing)